MTSQPHNGNAAPGGGKCDTIDNPGKYFIDSCIALNNFYIFLFQIIMSDIETDSESYENDDKGKFLYTNPYSLNGRFHEM